MSRFAGVGLALALAACTTEGVGEKQDVSELPAGALAHSGARDSVSRPQDGGTLRVGQYQEGQFTAQRGWVAYEIELSAGPADVFLHGQAPNHGDPLDTVLYVFGPKKANGKYPAQRLAFNDDAAANDVGSHLLVDLPATGTYRIVVSSYDNAIAFPRNVTRGDYKVIVKCPRDGGSDACGPAIQAEGGACFADTDCGAGLHCEGEIVCAPGTQCLHVQQGSCTADYTWLTYAPRQCGQNPWAQDPQPGDEDPSAVSVEEGVAIDNFFESKGVQLLEIGFLHHVPGRMVCMACSCPRGDSLLVKARAFDALRLQTEFGFTPVAKGALLETMPVQCNGNPWEESSDRYAEEEAVSSWLAGENAPISLVGFVEKTDSFMVCEACHCARGDRLVVAAGGDNGAASSAALGSLGFADIYRP